MSELIPDGWSEVALSDMAEIDSTSLKNTTHSDYEFHYIDIASVSTGKISVPSAKTRFSESPSRARRVIKNGDVLMSTVRPNLKAFAYFGNESGEYICSTGFSVIRAKNRNCGRFIFNSIISDDVSRQIEALVAGSNYPAINSSDVKNLQILCPTTKEQQQIASILTSVDEVIEKTEAQISKLQDLKRGMMQELLTKGIGHTEFKDSPVGRIPREWNVLPSSSVCKEIVVGIVIKPTQYYVPAGVPALRSANVRENGLNKNNCKFISKESNEELVKSKLEFGDLVSVRTGYPGTTAVVTEKFVGSNCVDLVISRPKLEIDSEYLCYWINSDYGKRQVLKIQGGLAQQHFNVGDMKKLLVAIPPKFEQIKIVSALKSVSDNIKLREKRSGYFKNTKKALMQDLLTGKVRVNTKQGGVM